MSGIYENVLGIKAKVPELTISLQMYCNSCKIYDSHEMEQLTRATLSQVEDLFSDFA